jgi:hypothetical protein
MKRRPLSLTIVGWLYIVTGALGFSYHLTDFWKAFAGDLVWVELVRLTAIVCGVYILRGRNWARWLAFAWIAFHVILSAFHTMPQLLMHSLLCAILGYLLFRPASSRYFQNGGTAAA